MSFLDFASRMFPFWCLGGLMAWSVWKSSHKDILAFNKASYFKFLTFMLCVTAWRVWLIKTALSHGYMDINQLAPVRMLPIGATAFVGWEDMCHTVPLVLLRRVLGTSKWMAPIHAIALVLVMLSFGMGHTYQGIGSAALISLYIPFGIYFGQKRGFGTLIAGHMTYDFLTMLAIRLAIG